MPPFAAALGYADFALYWAKERRAIRRRKFAGVCGAFHGRAGKLPAQRRTMKPTTLPRGQAPGIAGLRPQDGVFRCILKPVRENIASLLEKGIICMRVTVPGYECETVAR